LLISGAEFLLNERLRAGEDVAVEVVEQVEREQEQKCSQSGIDVGTELSEKSWQGTPVLRESVAKNKRYHKGAREETRDHGNEKTEGEVARGL
jgi:hypothetical protein